MTRGRGNLAARSSVPWRQCEGSDVQSRQARNTYLQNIQTKTGKSLSQTRELIRKSGLTKHGEIRHTLIDKLGLSYGDANALVHSALVSDGQSAAGAKGLSTDQVLDATYSGAKAPPRPIHEKLMATIQKLGPFEIAAKKGYVSLSRKKQFARIGPGTKGRLEIGLNLKGVRGTARLTALPPRGMRQYGAFLTTAGEVDK